MRKKSINTQLRLNAVSTNLLTNIRSKTNATSDSEVIRAALRVYGHLIDEQEKGSQIKIISTDGVEQTVCLIC